MCPTISDFSVQELNKNKKGENRIKKRLQQQQQLQIGEELSGFKFDCRVELDQTLENKQTRPMLDGRIV